jgi:hypothetical protein
VWGLPGVDSEFDLWSYFFDVRHPHDLDVELTVFWGAIIHVKSRNGVGPYFNLPMPRSMKGWQKKWFYLRNNVSALLPTFTSNCPIPLPNWGYGVVRKDLDKLRPMCEVLQQLQQEVLIGVHLLRTLFSHRI